MSSNSNFYSKQVVADSRLRENVSDDKQKGEKMLLAIKQLGLLQRITECQVRFKELRISGWRRQAGALSFGAYSLVGNSRLSTYLYEACYDQNADYWETYSRGTQPVEGVQEGHA